MFYEGKEFPRWNKHFIVATLKAKSIYLLNYDSDNDRIISSERIPIGYRVRDISVLQNGEIYLVTDERRIIKLSLSDKIKFSKTTKFKF